ncbi:MAG: RidA family protein [Pseudomonadota bacterium]
MAKRSSIYVDAFGHANPIPVACRVGNVLTSGIVYGLDPATGKVAPTLDDQCRLMFAHMRTIVEAGGGTVDDIVKITVWMVDRSQREPLNREWLAMFPDPQNRPARQAMQAETLGAGMLIQLDFMAVIDA